MVGNVNRADRFWHLQRPLGLLLALLVAAILGSPSPAQAQESEWTVHNLLGQSDELYGIWGNSGSDVFVVGNISTILHYDGANWSPMAIGIGHYLYGVWGSSGSDVFAVGNGGTILHYDGTSWTPMASGTTNGLSAVWGSSGSDVFAVSWNGMILHYDGTSWTPMTSGTTTQLNGVWGSSGSDVFAVGNGGTILHYDGSAWTPMTSGTTEHLYSVWGSSGSDVFAVGRSSTILHYDGSAWTPMTSGITNWLYSVWGSSGSDVFAMGSGGTILQYDGAAWTPMTSGTTNHLSGVWGSSGSDVFAVGNGGIILHYEGGAEPTGTPQLTIADDLVPVDSTVAVPVDLVANGHDLSAAHFTLYYDPFCLEPDLTDTDPADGLPDTIVLNQDPTKFQWDLDASFAGSGVLEFVVTASLEDPLPVLDEGQPLLTVPFAVNCSVETYGPSTQVSVGSINFGTADGGPSVPGTGDYGYVLLNLPPQPEDKNVSVDADGTVSIDLVAGATDPDGDDIILYSVGTPSNGGAAYQDFDGEIGVYLNSATYDPNGAFASLRSGESATDTFVYTLRDEHFATAEGTVTVTVHGVDDAPVATDDYLGGDGDILEDDVAVTLNVLANDTDPDANDTLTIVSVDTTTYSTQGSVDNNGDTLSYTPGDAFDFLSAGNVAYDAFAYTVQDGSGLTDIAYVQVQVTGENDAPVGQTYSQILSHYGTIFIYPYELASDVDTGDSLSVTAVDTTGTAGSVVLDTTNNWVSYTPPAGFSGTDTFLVTVSDPHGLTAVGTVQLTYVPTGLRGDCNGDGWMDVGDLPATVLEFFDGDDNGDYLQTPYGSFPGSPMGCDANEDHEISAGDLSCQVRMILDNPAVVCEAARSDGMPALLSLPALSAASVGEQVEVPVRLQSHGQGVVAAAFSLDLHGLALAGDDALRLPEGDWETMVLQDGGEVGVVIYSPSMSLLPDGAIATLSLQVLAADAQLRFGDDVAASLGSLQGASVPVRTDDGRAYPLFLPVTLR